MDKKITQLIGSAKDKNSVDTNTYVNLNMENSERLLPLNDINNVVNVDAQFNLERQSSKYYRIIGNINPLMTNVLFNTTGTEFSLEIFNNKPFNISFNGLEETTLTYEESIKENLKELNGWYGYFNKTRTQAALCSFYDMEPKRERFSLIPDLTNIVNQEVKNWNLIVTYPYSIDSTHYLINNGLLIVDKFEVVVGGKKMTALLTPVLHNLSNGDFIKLYGTNYDEVYEVKRVGLDNGDFKEYYFCIDVDINILNIGENTRFKKIYNNIESKYYFRIFKKVKTKLKSIIDSNDCDVYNLPFSKNIYSDDVVQFVFNDDIDITYLTDNLGRPISELYLTIIKTNSNNIFTNVSSGIESPVITKLSQGNTISNLRKIPIIQKIHTVASFQTLSYTPLETNVKIDDNIFYGDVVEYNESTLLEVVLSDVQHRFNTVNRETTNNSVVSGPRPEGYYYKAHYLIKIREFSSYIEEGTESTENKPSYAVNLGNGKYIWRDLLDIGQANIDGSILNYPYLNGAHYLYQNFFLNLKRQDPFDNWDMFYSKFPSDQIGNSLNNNFKVNSEDNVC